MANIYLHLLNMSLAAGVLVVAVVLLRLAFFKAPRWIHCLLWALVAVRLLCPFVIESDFSLMPSAATVPVSTLESAPEPPTTQPIVSDTPAPSNPVADIPVIDTPVVDTPVIDTPVVDTPVIDTPAVDTPIVNTPVEKPSSNVTVSTPAPKADTNPWQTVLSVASWLWLAGMLAMAIYAAVTTLRLRRQVVEAAHLRDNLWQCDHLRSPFILGVFRPRIYLPSDLDGIARDSVVAHEQAHLHRHDHWWKPLGFLLLTVYWFNPLMWVAYILLCRDIEAACDERVVRNMNADSRRSYSEALLLCSAPRRLVSACPLAFGETSVKSRIKSVLSYKKPTIWIIVAALLVSTVAGVCLLTDPKSDKPAKEPDSKTDITNQPTNPDEDTNSADPTAPLGLTHVIRTGLIDTGFIEYFGSSDVQQITSRTDLLAFLNAHHEEDMHWASVDWQISDFDQFDDTFFADNVLLLTYHGTSSGMHTPEVVGYTYSEDGTVLTVEFVEYHPSFVSSDLAAWLMFSGIKKTDLEGVTTITSHLLKEVPTDTYVAAFTEPTEHPETATEKWREFYEDWAGMHLREMLTRLNDGGWEDSVAINRALNFVGCVWIDGDIYYITHQFDGIMSTDGKVGWLTTEESVRVSWLFDGEEDPIYQLIAKAKKVDGNHVLMECVESEWLTGDVWVDFSRFSVSTVKIGEHYRIFYDYMEVTDPPRVTPVRVMLAPVNGTTTTNPIVTNPTTTPTKPTTPTSPTKPTISPTAPVTFVKFSSPSDSPSDYYTCAQYMYPVQPDAATCEWLRKLASRTNWVKRDTQVGAYDAYFTIGDDEEYYYIDRVNRRVFHNRWFLSLSAEEVNKLDALIRSYGIQNNSPVTGTAEDWRYLTGRIQEFVDGENGYVLLKVNYQGPNLYGDVVKVSTRFIPRQFFATGSTVCVVYDGELDVETTPFTIYAGAMNELKENAIISTGVSLYDDLLRQIQTCFYDRSAVQPDCSSVVWSCDSLLEVGARLVDLDKDGQDELVIDETNAIFWIGIHDVYTIKDGKLVHLFSSEGSDRYALCKGGYVCKEWSEKNSISNEDYFRIEGDNLVFLEGVSLQIGSNTAGSCYHVTIVNGEKQYEPITLEEAEKIMQKYGKDDVTYGVHVIPFSL